MSKFWTLLICSVISAAVATPSNVVPVLLWSSDSSTPQLVNPLQKTSKLEFENLLSERLSQTQPPILLFVKDNFCVENIKSNQESLQRLNSAGSLTYWTSVESASSVFENLLSYNVTKGDDVESISEGQIVVLPVNDLSTIPDIYSTFRDDSLSPVVAVTGKSCSYSFTSSERIKRQAAPSGKADEDDDNKHNVTVKDKRILLYVEKITLEKNEGEKILDVQTNEVSTNETTYTLTLNGLDFSITAYFNQTGGYYELVEVLLQEGKGVKESLTIERPMVFPFNFSYHCSSDTKFSSDSTVLKFTNLQIQMDAEIFGDAYDCVGFTSIPIWSGIFVTGILALIMIWGLAMIMDIRTMDRFDDPKGKTITVTAQE